MDFLRGVIGMYAKGARGVGEMGQRMWADIVAFDPWNIEDYTQVNWSAILLLVVAIGLGLLVVAAQLTESPDAPGVSKTNWALGKDAVAVAKKDAPPLPPPTEVVAMYVYPIKSCRGFEIDSTRLRKSGLILDRNWMFIDRATRKFLTIRSDPSMTLIDTNIVEGKITETKPGAKKAVETTMQMLEVSIHGKDQRITVPAFPTQEWLKTNTTLSTVEIWEKETDAYEYGSEINTIFKEYFDKDVALVYKGPTARMVAVNGSKDMYGSETPHHFADVMSLQVASQASLDDLNRRLSEAKDSSGKAYDGAKLTIERFRPNIIVKGRADHPWEEDTWKRIRFTTTIPDEGAIYKLDLDVVARCARCQVPNVNPETADKHPKQPWDELMRFRRVDDGGPAKWKPCFGMLCLPKNEGKLKVGAKLDVLETTNNHKYNTAKFEDL